jgi:hypothetical protein
MHDLNITLDEVARAVFKEHDDVMRLHFRAIACHCECLGMNAENSWAVCNNSPILFAQDQYNEVMKKWGLINEKSEPNI